jgi:hypothetical protein
MTTKRSIKKALVDNLGRFVGLCETDRGKTDVNVEYGTHDKEGNFRVRGVATIRNISELSADLRWLADQAIENDTECWDI